MACIGCSCSTGKGEVSGCKTTGGCASGGCNRHNTYDWITALGIRDALPFEVVEVSFKNGSRKEFFKNPAFTRATTGDWVVVEVSSGGFDVGKVSLSGELVRLQMKRKRVKSDARLLPVVRKAHERDLERLQEVRQLEKTIMVQARTIARALDLDMKVGDVEFQGDGRKCTFFYTADGRVDFRELIRHYAKEFKVKIEMRQIGARQESARIGGLGNCGRELCCSTWLTEFKSVNTAAARYQNLAINQTKLSGMCGRLKCCLNYELDSYIDALEDFPDRADRLKTAAGMTILIKTDVFKRLMFYTYAEDRGKLYPLHVDQVWEALDMLKQGKAPGSLDDIAAMAPPPTVEEVEDDEPDFENVHDVVELPLEKRKKKKKKKSKVRDRSQSAAAALEKEPLPSFGRPNPPSRGRPDNRQGRNEQGRPNAPRPTAGPDRKPEPNPARPEAPRPPQGKPEVRRDGQPPREQMPPRRDPRPDNRPPQQGPPQGKPKQPDARKPGQGPDRSGDKPAPEKRDTPRPPQQQGGKPSAPPSPPNNNDGNPDGGRRPKDKWPPRSKGDKK